MIERAIQIKRPGAFILMSGHIDKEVAISAANQNCPVKIVEKPADIAELESLIHQFCENSQAKGLLGTKQIA